MTIGRGWTTWCGTLDHNRHDLSSETRTHDFASSTSNSISFLLPSATEIFCFPSSASGDHLDSTPSFHRSATQGRARTYPHHFDPRIQDAVMRRTGRCLVRNVRLPLGPAVSSLCVLLLDLRFLSGLSWCHIFHTQSLPIATQQLRILIVHRVRIVNSNRGRPLVGCVSCGPHNGSTNVSSSTGLSSSPGKTVAAELVKVHQLRSQLGLHQSPSMSLFTCRKSQLLWKCFDDPSRKGNPTISSHQAHAYSRSPSMMCSFSRDTTFLHHALHWNHVSWNEGWYHSWSSVQRSPGIQLVGGQRSLAERGGTLSTRTPSVVAHLPERHQA